MDRERTAGGAGDEGDEMRAIEAEGDPRQAGLAASQLADRADQQHPQRAHPGRRKTAATVAKERGVALPAIDTAPRAITLAAVRTAAPKARRTRDGRGGNERTSR